MRESGNPRSAAEVAAPIRKLWPEYLESSTPCIKCPSNHWTLGTPLDIYPLKQGVPRWWCLLVRMTTFESIELIHLTGITCMCEVGLSNWFASQLVCLPVQCKFWNLYFFLVDTEKLYTEVTQSIVDHYGKTYDWSIKTQVMGRPPLDAVKVAMELLELPLTPMEFHTELYSKLNSKFPDANMMPGVV